MACNNNKNEVKQPPRPPVAQSSDNNWPAEIQVSWPWFVMGVSQTWLKLIEAVTANDPRQDHADLPLLLDYYQTINERVTTGSKISGRRYDLMMSSS